MGGERERSVKKGIEKKSRLQKASQTEEALVNTVRHFHLYGDKDSGLELFAHTLSCFRLRSKISVFCGNALHSIVLEKLSPQPEDHTT